MGSGGLFMPSSLKALSLCLGLFGAGAAVAADPAWVQMTATGAQARAVTEAPACPQIMIDGHAQPMIERAAPTDAFPGRVCQADLPQGAQRVSIDGAALPSVRPQVNRLVILGDSGCRLLGAFVQNCNDPSAWPFARVATLAAAKKPDLVVHVGDYYYRETPCPATAAGCTGSPYGDRWPSWQAEVYTPAAPLLAAAPWVFARGNHEDCSRGGAGWFRLLDAAPTPKSCPAQSDTFALDIGGVNLLIVDSADTEDNTAPAPLTATFAARLDSVPKTAGGEPVWIVTHRPFWFAFPVAGALTDGKTNQTERAAVKGLDLSGVALVLSGHVHNLTSLDFGPARPPQLIVGTGGDVLDGKPPAISGNANVDGLAAQVFTFGRFGYFVFDRQGDDWVGAFYDLADTVVARCHLHARELSCAEAS
jgi:hypothetical protein